MARLRKAVKAMLPYSPPTSGRKGMLRLDFNENTLSPSGRVFEALASIDGEDLASYPEYSAFEDKLARSLSVDARQVVVTNATDEGIRLFLDTFVEPGSHLVLPVPTFAIFRFYAELNGVRVRQVPYNTDLSFPTDAVLEAMDEDAGGVILCHPNNPTGTLVPDDAMERILARALELDDMAVLVDEAYYEFCGKTALPLIERYPGLVVSRTFSKAYGLAGLRVGYLVTNAEAAAGLRKAGSPYSVNHAALAAAGAALDERDQIEAYVAEVDKARKVLVDGLEKRGLRVHVGAANFVLAWFGARSRLIQRALAERSVLIRDRSADQGLAGVLRITIGTQDQVERALAAFEEVLEHRALLFDMDGVLVDVSRSYREAIRQTAEHFLGRAVSAEEIQRAKEGGNAADDWRVTQAIIERGGVEVDFEDVKSHFQDLYLGSGGQPGLREQEVWVPEKGLLEGLRERFSLGIVTARPREEALWALERFGARDLFGAVICQEDAPAKPDPAGLVAALDELGCCGGVYFGDGVDDLAAAGACGLTPVGVRPAGIDAPDIAEVLSGAGAVHVIDSVNLMEEEWLG